ncbi:MAG: hypothetical protein J6B93_02640 [Clostridia bacterium]|nr:hypothetical protein [Clostridia bacterium]
MKKVISLLIIAALMLSVGLSVSAAVPKSYGYDAKASAVGAPPAYEYSAVITGKGLGLGEFSSAADMYVADDKLYISDTGNNRIVVLNSDYTPSSVITHVVTGQGEEALNAPRGIFYADGLLYICDSGNQRVIAIDGENKVQRTILKPDSSLVSDMADFTPSRVGVNASGTVYVIADGIYQGFCQYDAADSFIGFFGANRVEITPTVIFQHMLKNIFTKEQREALVRTIPTEYSNVYVDDEDIIYATTHTATSEQVRKLNASGSNIMVYPGSNLSLLGTGFNRKNFGDQAVNYVKGEAVKSKIVDIHKDADGIMAVLDGQRGRIFLYDNEQNQLCIFGGEGIQKGYFKNAVSLEKFGNDYLVADTEKNNITVFTETKYMSNIRSAIRAYNDGNYDESGRYWQMVLDKNGNLSAAFKGVGRMLLNNGDYKEAMQYLKDGNDRYYYSMAVQQYRRDFVRDNFLVMVLVAALVVTGLVFAIKYLKKWLLKGSPKAKIKG